MRNKGITELKPTGGKYDHTLWKNKHKHAFKHQCTIKVDICCLHNLDWKRGGDYLK